MLCSQAVALSGYVFFGSSVLLGDQVRDLALAVSAAARDSDARIHAALRKFPSVGPNIDIPPNGRGTAVSDTGAIETNGDLNSLSASAAADGRLAGLDLSRAASALCSARRFLLLDFSGISGMDATAAATFKKMSLSCGACGVALVITGVRRPSPRWSLLVGNGVVEPGGGQGAPGGAHGAPSGTCPCFDTLDDALAWCEAHFLEVRVVLSIFFSSV